MSEHTSINVVEVGELLEFKNICAQHPEKADHNPAPVAVTRARPRHCTTAVPV